MWSPHATGAFKAPCGAAAEPSGGQRMGIGRWLDTERRVGKRTGCGSLHHRDDIGRTACGPTACTPLGHRHTHMLTAGRCPEAGRRGPAIRYGRDSKKGPQRTDRPREETHTARNWHWDTVTGWSGVGIHGWGSAGGVPSAATHPGPHAHPLGHAREAAHTFATPHNRTLTLPPTRQQWYPNGALYQLPSLRHRHWHRGTPPPRV